MTDSGYEKDCADYIKRWLEADAERTKLRAAIEQHRQTIMRESKATSRREGGPLVTEIEIDMWNASCVLWGALLKNDS